MTNYLEEENNQVRRDFNLEEIIDFSLKYRVEIMLGSDMQYQCQIQNKVYYVSISPMHALMMGIKTYKRHILNEV